MKTFSEIKRRIKKNEGYVNHKYIDSLGFPTIGYGHLIKKNQKKLLKGVYSKKTLSNIFEQDFKKTLESYLKCYKKEKHEKNIKEVYIEMIFQLGINKQIKFFKMNKHIKKNELFMAALEMKNSLWFKQTPKRVNMLIKTLLQKRYEKKR